MENAILVFNIGLSLCGFAIIWELYLIFTSANQVENKVVEKPDLYNTVVENRSALSSEDEHIGMQQEVLNKTNIIIAVLWPIALLYTIFFIDTEAFYEIIKKLQSLGYPLYTGAVFVGVTTARLLFHPKTFLENTYNENSRNIGLLKVQYNYIQISYLSFMLGTIALIILISNIPQIKELQGVITLFIVGNGIYMANRMYLSWSFFEKIQDFFKKS